MMVKQCCPCRASIKVNDLKKKLLMLEWDNKYFDFWGNSFATLLYAASGPRVSKYLSC